MSSFVEMRTARAPERLSRRTHVRVADKGGGGWGLPRLAHGVEEGVPLCAVAYPLCIGKLI